MFLITLFSPHQTFLAHPSLHSSSLIGSSRFPNAISASALAPVLLIVIPRAPSSNDFSFASSPSASLRPSPPAMTTTTPAATPSASSSASSPFGASTAPPPQQQAAPTATAPDAEAASAGDLGGHVFAKKTFGKPTYCQHCCDKIWGMLSQGYACEVCNLVTHDKCMRAVVAQCTGRQLQLIKNPVAHTWTDPQHIKRHFCCVCRKRTDDTLSAECEVCNCYVHAECQDLAVADCREAATFVPSLDRVTHKQYHHMREGNLPRDAPCAVCRKGCQSAECMSGFRCQWCNQSVHSSCLRQLKPQCDFGPLRRIMLPPNAVTIPRTELPMDLLLNIHTQQPHPTTSKLLG